MLPEKRTKTNIGIGVGILLEVAGRIAISLNEALGIPGLIIVFVGVVLFVWGCMNYAEGKGHSKWLGFLGLLSIIGLIILIVLPDRHKTEP
ncbi:MAG TPA: hypothetical protein VFY06_11300 [Verrucomicrobiae bacterium]|nr:hypothetical protein [Verrucomicrobiae bacterium]